MYFGKKQITAFATFKNESKIEEDLHVEVVKNGEYSIDAPAGTVYKKVSASVNVPVPEQQELSVDVAENGEFVNTAPDGKAYNKVTVNVNVPSKEEQEKSVTISKNGTIEVVPDAGKVLSSVKVTADVKSDITILDNIPIALDFSNGSNQVVEAPKGYAVKAATIQKPATLIPENIAEGVEIAGVVGTHVGGGEGEKPFDCHSVTFVCGDKSYVRSVADGDTCADPVKRGLIPTPTKESTNAEDFTFSGGWSATPNGEADANILKNITEDKTVYAAFTATARLYTITWLDDDGSVLTTTQVAYGSVPSYTPAKTDWVFAGWIPTPTAVTGNASYTATWSDVIASGELDANVSWSLSSAGVMFVYGDGNITSWADAGSHAWHSYRDSIKQVRIDTGIKVIGNYAFADCPNLESVEIPNGATYNIGKQAFANAKKLTSIIIPQSITRIQQYAFNGCAALASAVFLDTDGWGITANSGGATTPVDVTNPADAAYYLRSYYSHCWWSKT
jgi:hypothetical protein